MCFEFDIIDTQQFAFALFSYRRSRARPRAFTLAALISYNEHASLTEFIALPSTLCTCSIQAHSVDTAIGLMQCSNGSYHDGRTGAMLFLMLVGSRTANTGGV